MRLIRKLVKKKFAVNENRLAALVAAHEGKKESVSIGQIKEVQRILLWLLGEEWKRNPRGVKELLLKDHNDKKKVRRGRSKIPGPGK